MKEKVKSINLDFTQKNKNKNKGNEKISLSFLPVLLNLLFRNVCIGFLNELFFLRKSNQLHGLL